MPPHTYVVAAQFDRRGRRLLLCSTGLADVVALIADALEYRVRTYDELQFTRRYRAEDFSRIARAGFPLRVERTPLPIFHLFRPLLQPVFDYLRGLVLIPVRTCALRVLYFGELPFMQTRYATTHSICVLLYRSTSTPSKGGSALSPRMALPSRGAAARTLPMKYRRGVA